MLRWGAIKLSGPQASSVFAFSAILFTSGLDVGLIMFPLTEFPVYENGDEYSFTNPLAVEFGFWGFLVWGFYFLTTFYFAALEPKLKLFEIPLIRWTNNFVIIATCAFTAYLFLSYLPSYVPGISDTYRYLLVGVVVFCAVASSIDIRFVKYLSLASTWLFFALIFLLWWQSDMGLGGLSSGAHLIADYFVNLPKFVLPISELHEFYLFWWFAWSIMIGQFVARFLGALSTRQLLLALLIIPSIPIAIWFSVLYYYHVNQLELSGLANMAMIGVGIIFVINSLDSLIRLYTTNLNFTAADIGVVRYLLINWLLMFGLTLLYQFTPFEIQWVGLVVIGIYAGVYYLITQRRVELRLS